MPKFASFSLPPRSGKFTIKLQDIMLPPSFSINLTSARIGAKSSMIPAIAISSLSSDSSTKNQLSKLLKVQDVGLEISKVIENNFRQSGLFNPLNKDSFLQKPDIAHLKPRFEDWSLIKAQALITGKVTYSEDKLRVEFRLWDVLAAKEMMALAFTTCLLYTSPSPRD